MPVQEDRGRCAGQLRRDARRWRAAVGRKAPRAPTRTRFRQVEFALASSTTIARASPRGKEDACQATASGPRSSGRRARTTRSAARSSPSSPARSSPRRARAAETRTRTTACAWRSTRPRANSMPAENIKRAIERATRQRRRCGAVRGGHVRGPRSGQRGGHRRGHDRQPEPNGLGDPQRLHQGRRLAVAPWRGSSSRRGSSAFP